MPKTTIPLYTGCPATRLPGKREIERMRAEYNAWKRPVVWSDRSDDVISERITDEVISPRKGVRARRFILGHEPIDINEPPAAARLISTTAAVQDSFDVPNSLSFIR
jgi:hypothetical protein